MMEDFRGETPQKQESHTVYVEKNIPLADYLMQITNAVVINETDPHKVVLVTAACNLVNEAYKKFLS